MRWWTLSHERMDEMMYKIEEVLTLTVGTTAVEQEIRYQGFLIENLSESATVYFRDKEADGADCTAGNGFALAPGARTEVVLTARTLSLIASAASTDVRLLIVDLG